MTLKDISKEFNCSIFLSSNRSFLSIDNIDSEDEVYSIKEEVENIPEFSTFYFYGFYNEDTDTYGMEFTMNKPLSQFRDYSTDYCQ